MRSQTSRPHSIRTTLRLEHLEPRDVPHALALTPLVEVSGPSPFLGHPIEANDPAFTINSEVQPYLAVDPNNSNHLVGVWIQDFARGIVAAVSFDAGTTWQSAAVPGITVASGGVYPRSSDPWVSFSPNGDVYLSIHGHDIPFTQPNAILVSKSIDGGRTWGNPTTLIEDHQVYNDKECITADPYNTQYAYASWTRFIGNGQGLAMFSRTTDGGQTWEPAREIRPRDGKIANVSFQIVVLPDGTVLNFFTEQTFLNAAGGINHFKYTLNVIRSSDHGQTWQESATPLADILPLNDTRAIPGAVGVPNPDGGTGIDAQNWFFDVDTDPANGNLYVVWQDARFSDRQYTSIAFAMSSDGGVTWSAPIKINQTPDDIPEGNQQAINPSVAVNQDGVVAVTYYDFRNNTPAPGLPTDYWMVHAHPEDGLTNPASWSSENRMTPTSFNMENAPVRSGYFLGDYEGLVAMGKHFGALFSMPTGADPASVFFRDPLPADATEESSLRNDCPSVDGGPVNATGLFETLWPVPSGTLSAFGVAINLRFLPPITLAVAVTDPDPFEATVAQLEVSPVSEYAAETQMPVAIPLSDPDRVTADVLFGTRIDAPQWGDLLGLFDL